MECYIQNNAYICSNSLPEKWQTHILTHFALPKRRNLGNFVTATGKGIWRSCFVYVKRAQIVRVHTQNGVSVLYSPLSLL